MGICEGPPVWYFSLHNSLGTRQGRPKPRITHDQKNAGCDVSCAPDWQMRVVKMV